MIQPRKASIPVIGKPSSAVQRDGAAVRKHHRTVLARGNGHRELPGRDLEKIPHPRISDHLEEYARVAREGAVEIRLIHLNHSNPVACPGTREAELVSSVGVAIAEEGEMVDL